MQSWQCIDRWVLYDDDEYHNGDNFGHDNIDDVVDDDDDDEAFAAELKFTWLLQFAIK